MEAARIRGQITAAPGNQSQRKNEMSLLDQSNAEVILFPEKVTTDIDGNTRTRPSKVGAPLKVWLAPIGRTMYVSPETGELGLNLTMQ